MQRFQFLKLAVAAVIAVPLLLSGCGDKKTAELKVGATAGPHAANVQKAAEVAKKQGLNVKVIEFTDYISPNKSLEEGSLDIVIYQHEPFLKNFNANQKTDLVAVAPAILMRMGIYSNRVKNVNELKDGATVGIPNDPTNGGRALQLLAGAGLLKLKEGVGHAATVEDIIDNPLRLRIVEVEAATLPRTLDDARAAVINQTYALPAGLNPVKDSLLIESKDSPYANMVAIRTGDNRPELVELNNALHTPEVKQFILEHYKGSLIPSF